MTRQRLSIADFASLVVLPVVIDKPGNYLTRAGEIVEVSATSERHDFGCRGRYTSCGLKDKWHRSGRLYFSILSNNDIVSKA